MKSGFVTILGKPNVGKSTLLNAIIGKKISIITNKSQTTRDAIQGIYNDDDSQIIFVDTPGIHKPNSELDRKMDKQTYSNIRNNDLSLLVVDASRRPNEEDEFIFNCVRIETPLLVVFNKIDLTNIELIGKLKEIYKEKFPNAKFIEIVATESFNLDTLIKEIKELLPEGPQYYDTKTITNRDFKFMVQEIIREKMLLLLKEEVPHSCAVLCDDINFYKEKNIYAKIVVEKDGQKGIVIGKQGKMIKKIGTLARKDIEELVGHNVNLELFVQVVKDWRNSASFLTKIGLNDE